MSESNDLIEPEQAERLRAGQLRIEIDDLSWTLSDDDESGPDHSGSDEFGTGASIVAVGAATFSVLFQGRSFIATVVARRPDEVVLSAGGHEFVCRVTDRRRELLQRLGASGHTGPATNEVRAPMPGLVVKIPVSTGDSVTRNQALVVLEAMKMENELRAPDDALIAEIHVSEGESVAKDALLLSLTPTESTS